MTALMTCAALRAAGPWRPLRHCPGRSVWPGPVALTPGELAGAGATEQVFVVPAAPDPVHVVALGDGGLISYRKPDGRFLHTLNTRDGFLRKLAQLGITLEAGRTTPAARPSRARASDADRPTARRPRD